MSTLAIIADTHLPKRDRRVPQPFWERLGQADAIVHAGDLIAESVLGALKGLGPPVHAVCGNVDSPALRRRLPETLLLEIGAVRLGVIHDAGLPRGRLARMQRRFPHAHAVVFGHSHLPLHETAGEFQIFNPGSPTERRRAPTHTMGLARVGTSQIDFELLDLDPKAS